VRQHQQRYQELFGKNGIEGLGQKGIKMGMSRDPDKSPKADPAQDAEAFIVGMKRIQLICGTPEDEPHDPDTPPISLYVYTNFIPAKGEILILEDGKRVEVQNVCYSIGTAGKSKMKALVPCVYATLCRNKP
jgi:hypothetical protein